MKSKFTNPFAGFEKHEWILWIVSLAIVTASSVIAPNADFLTWLTTVLGVTALVFAAKGHVMAQVASIVFCVLYSVIACRYHYWGEMFTFLGMSTPMCIWSLVTWLKNPSDHKADEVKVRTLSRKGTAGVLLVSIPVTVVFGLVLRWLNTPNLNVSTISVTASFLGAAFSVLRSPWYALSYAFNDIILIILWVLASLTDTAYIPVAVNFIIFLVNDLYAFYCWRVREAGHSVPTR